MAKIRAVNLGVFGMNKSSSSPTEYQRRLMDTALLAIAKVVQDGRKPLTYGDVAVAAGLKRIGDSRNVVQALGLLVSELRDREIETLQ